VAQVGVGTPPPKISTGTIRISRYLRSAQATLKDPEVVLIDVPVVVHKGVLAVGIGLGHPGAAEARLEVAEVLLIHVGVTVEVTRR